MILKGSCRANGADLATHLMNGYDNERAELGQVRGTIADDLHGAFAEIELIASGTRAEKPLFSLSINPHEALTREQYFEAIDAIEHKLGFAGQPRAVVFHEKEGREHCHVVWSRIDAASMKAIPDSFYKSRLCDMAIVLAEKFGHELPEGLKAWKEKTRQLGDKLEPTLAETVNAKKTGISAEQRREEITAAYVQADSAAALVNALEEKGYVLAKGDSRAFVIVDQFGDVHSLSRYVKGVRAKEIKARLAALDAERFPTVDQAKELARSRLAAQEERLREQQDVQQDHRHDDQGHDRHDRDHRHDRHDDHHHDRRDDDEDDDDDRHRRSIDEKRAAMEQVQRARRLAITQAEQELLTLHQEEKLALDAAQKAESGGLLFRMRTRVAELIDSRPALRSVLRHITEKVGLDPRERHRLEQEALARRHSRERTALAGKKRAIEKIEQREQASLARDLKREALQRMLRREQLRAAAKAEGHEVRADVDILRTDPRLLEEGAFGRAFNAEATAEEGDVRDDRGEAKLRKRAAWVTRQQRYFSQFLPRTPERRFVAGETHLYLGRQYRLKVVPHVQEGVKLIRGFIVVQTHRPTRPEVTRELVDAWYRDRAHIKFPERIELCLGLFPDPEAFRPKGLIVRQTRQRWGSMSPAGRLLLNRRLVQAPVDAIDYVITHELCHVAEPHHGTAFFELLDKVMPDWERRKQRLERAMA